MIKRFLRDKLNKIKKFKEAAFIVFIIMITLLNGYIFYLELTN